MNRSTSKLKPSRWPGSSRESGFTLIEMMIAITIGLGILAGLVGVLAANSNNARTNDRTSELMSNGRYALNSMKQELRQAGFRAYTWAEPTAPGALGTLTNECLAAGETAGTFVSNIRQGVWGANNSNPFSASCIPSTSYATGNDVLVVRRVASPPTGCPDGSSPPCADTLYFQSSYSTGQVFRGATAPVFADGLTPVESFPVQIYVYYISPFTVSERETPLVPALYRVALQSDGSMSRELVASGIEHFQVQYGRLTVAVPATTQFSDTLTGSSVNTVASDWDNVESVRIWLLARNETAEPGYSNTNSYVMGDQTYDFAAAPDGFRRQLFSTVVQLRN
jgi:type IV pilus assembly protein PilW